MPIASDMTAVFAGAVERTQQTARQVGEVLLNLSKSFSKPSFSYELLGSDTTSDTTTDNTSKPTSSTTSTTSRRRQLGYWLRWICAALAALFVLYSIQRYAVSVSGGSLTRARRSLTKQQYIDAVLREPIEGAVDLGPIQHHCSHIKVQPGLIWHCDVLIGGLGNVGNQLVNNVLFGLEAGASTIILPRIGQPRRRGHSTDLADLFDLDMLMGSWAAACPQIKLVKTLDDLQSPDPYAEEENNKKETEKEVAPAKLEAWNLRGLERVRYAIADPVNYRGCFDSWLERFVLNSANMSDDNPVRILSAAPFFQWHRAFQDTDFALAFSRLFFFNREMRRLGASVLWHMEQRLGRPVVADAILFPDSQNASLVTSLQRNRIVSDGFMGVHLRTASDAVKFRWPSYDAQAPYYINTTLERNLTSVYIATGSPEHRALFINDTAPLGLDVYWKEELLADSVGTENDDLAALKSLSWDQQAVVDLQVLLYAGFFTGMGRSSFSWSVAIRRGVIPEAGRSYVDYGCYERAIKDKPKEEGYVPDSTEEVGYSDDLNVVRCDYLVRLAHRIWQ